MAVDLDPHETPDGTELPSPRKSKRSFFRLEKKKKKNENKKNDADGGDGTSAPSPAIHETMPLPASPVPSPRSPDHCALLPTLAARSGAHPCVSPSSPSSPARPRLSTSSSQIFERDVQEHLGPGANMSVPASPAGLPHLQTEDRVPPVLSASSIAITDQGCGVEDVEIVTHPAHQPAVAGLAPGGPHRPSSHGRSSLDSRSEDASHYYHSADDLVSPAADKQRLSFISFADVVQAEQSQQQLGDTADPAPAISTIAGKLGKRSPSPMRLANGIDVAQPGSAADEWGELTIETMGQALRRTRSGDLGQQRSPVGGFDRMA